MNWFQKLCCRFIREAVKKEIRQAYREWCYKGWKSREAYELACRSWKCGHITGGVNIREEVE